MVRGIQSKNEHHCGKEAVGLKFNFAKEKCKDFHTTLSGLRRPAPLFASDV